MAGAKLGAFSNSQTVRFRYCGISANWGRQTLHRLRKKKAPPKRGRAQGRLACSRKGGISFRRRTIRGAEDSSALGRQRGADQRTLGGVGRRARESGGGHEQGRETWCILCVDVLLPS